jgi:3-keto-5-aminohexanoate cleavage enzyme
MPNPIITAALTGPVATKADNPGLPGSVAEIAAAAKASYDAGAAVIHIHLRDDQGDMTADLGVAKRTVEAVREVCPGITQLSTGGLQFTYEERMKLVEARPPWRR